MMSHVAKPMGQYPIPATPLESKLGTQYKTTPADGAISTLPMIEQPQFSALEIKPYYQPAPILYNGQPVTDPGQITPTFPSTYYLSPIMDPDTRRNTLRTTPADGTVPTYPLRASPAGALESIQNRQQELRQTAATAKALEQIKGTLSNINTSKLELATAGDPNNALYNPDSLNLMTGMLNALKEGTAKLSPSQTQEGETFRVATFMLNGQERKLKLVETPDQKGIHLYQADALSPKTWAGSGKTPYFGETKEIPVSSLVGSINAYGQLNVYTQMDPRNAYGADSRLDAGWYGVNVENNEASQSAFRQLVDVLNR